MPDSALPQIKAVSRWARNLGYLAYCTGGIAANLWENSTQGLQIRLLYIESTEPLYPDFNGPMLYFIALLPPGAIQAEVTRYKQHFAEQYHSRQALKSPPHVTLQAPFEWEVQKQGLLETFLQGFAELHPPIPIVLSGFGAFPPRVIYVNVQKTPELLGLQSELAATLKSSLGIDDPNSQGRTFSPHMTIAFKDLKTPDFHRGWAEFKDRELSYESVVQSLTLLRFQDRQWHICGEFSFNSPGSEPGSSLD